MFYFSISWTSIFFKTSTDPLPKRTSDRKSHQNKTPKVATVSINYAQEGVAGRLTRKVDAMIDAHDHTNSPLSKSLLDLLPQHVNNTNSSIQTALRRDRSSDDAAISGPLYSYDTNRASPTSSGREVDLGGLVELAEKKWKSEQTDRVVKEEYEVLDNRGETTVLTGGKGKGKRGSPKQRAVKSDPAVVQNVVEEDDGFELV